MSDFFYKTEVPYFNNRFTLNKDILRFNISMEKSMIMNIVKSYSNLLNDISNLIMGKRIII